MKTYYSAGTGYNKHLVLSVFLILLLGVCLIASIWSIIHFSSNNIAYADNGVVNNNYFTDFNTFISSGSSISSYDPFVFSYGANWVSVYINLDDFITFNDIYTFTCYGSSSVDNSSVFLVRSGDISINQVVLSSVDNVYSFTIDFTSLSYSSYILLFTGLSGVSNSISWLKIEKGSSFTGYVPKEYLNYGYNQGYTDGSTNNPVLNSSYINASDWTSYVGDLFGGSHWGLSTNNYNYTNYFTYNDKNYGYYNFSSGGDGQGSFNLTFSLVNSSATDYYATCFIGSVTGGSYSFVFSPSDSYDIVVVSDNINLITKYSPYANVIINDKAVYLLNISVPSKVFLCAKNVNTNLVVHSYSYSLGFNYTNLYIKTGEQFQYDSGYSSGYSAGIAQGKSIGYTEGYNYATSLNPQDYTFLGLFGAVVQAPVNVVRDMLNFELMGINLTAFFYSMISIALVLFILRLFL